MAEMEKLGKIFRQRYVLERKFLNEQYTPKEVRLMCNKLQSTVLVVDENYFM